ncbi:MAG: phosphoribosylglycinamide formyltransferase [Paracoccaceae bacterium]|jgi:phosphoribosylglycinamide formyltransferase-1|nr:phosphoribosylglycinamide formyltransferase [Paracoccaceae bacterium]
MRRVAILISGAGSNMVRLVEALQAEDSPGEAVVVVSNDPAAGGLARAEALGVPALAVDHRPFGRDRAAFEAALDTALAPFAPDLICLAGFMRILTAGFVSRWEGRILNVHPSLLPALKGLDTHARALAEGHAEHGCTVHLVTPALDDGPILGQARVPVEPGDTPASLGARVQAAEHRLYPAVLLRVLRGERTQLLMP